MFRKCLAPSSGKSAAASRCLRGVGPPFAQTSRLRSLSLFVLSFAGLPVSLQRFDSSPHHPSVAAAHYLSLRRSSRAPWSPLLASLSSMPPHAQRPLVTLSLRRGWVGFALTLAAYRPILKNRCRYDSLTIPQSLEAFFRQV